MHTLVEFAEGPLLRFSLAVLILGLVAQVGLALWHLVVARRKSSKPEIQWRAILRATARQMGPIRYLRGPHGYYTGLTLALHVALLVVPLFLAGHLYLLERATGIGWPAIPMPLADALTGVGLLAAAALVVARIASPSARHASRAQDWGFLIGILAIFGSGICMVHPRFDPLPYPGTRLVHVLAGDLLLVSLPFSKVSHMVLLPFSQLLGEFGWRFVPGAGERVKATLGRQGEGV